MRHSASMSYSWFGDVCHNQRVSGTDVFITCFHKCVMANLKTSFLRRHSIECINLSLRLVNILMLVVPNHRIDLYCLLWVTIPCALRPAGGNDHRPKTKVVQAGLRVLLLLECISLQDLRKRMINKYYWNPPRMFRCDYLMRMWREILQKFYIKVSYLNLI